MGAATLKPIKRVCLADDVADQLRQAIVSGQMKPGDPLAEPTLVEQFGVSRAPIREALIALEREGLVQFDDRGRTRVVLLEPNDFEEICALRGALECLAARIAASRWNEADASRISDIVDRQQRARSFTELSRLDVDFHEEIVRMSANRRVLAAWLVLRGPMEVCLTQFFVIEKKHRLEPRDVTVKAHRELISALSSGDPDKAAAAMAKHIESWRHWVSAK